LQENEAVSRGDGRQAVPVRQDLKREATAMEFRWAAIIALWTLLTGPIFNSPSGAATRPPRSQAAVATQEAAPER
jgi:hypothetical protein